MNLISESTGILRLMDTSAIIFCISVVSRKINMHELARYLIPQQRVSSILHSISLSFPFPICHTKQTICRHLETCAANSSASYIYPVDGQKSGDLHIRRYSFSLMRACCVLYCLVVLNNGQQSIKSRIL